MIFIIICFHVFLSNIVSPFSRYRWRCDSCSDQNWNRMDPLEKKDFAYLLQQTRVSEVCRHAWQQSKSIMIGGPLWGESTKRMRQFASSDYSQLFHVLYLDAWALPCLSFMNEFSGVVLSCFTLSRQTCWSRVLLIQPDDSLILLSKATVFSGSWVKKHVHSHPECLRSLPNQQIFVFIRVIPVFRIACWWERRTRDP